MSFRKFCKVLTDNDFYLARVNGGHYIYKRDSKIVVVPNSKLKPYIIKNAFKKFKLEGKNV